MKTSKAVILKKMDILLIALLCLLAFIFVAFIHRTQAAGALVTIQHQGKTLHTVPLDKAAVFDIKDAQGMVINRVEISHGTAKMVHAECPDKHCISQGQISQNHQMIVCLPHRVMVTVSASEQPNVDVVAR